MTLRMALEDLCMNRPVWTELGTQGGDYFREHAREIARVLEPHYLTFIDVLEWKVPS